MVSADYPVFGLSPQISGSKIGQHFFYIALKAFLGGKQVFRFAPDWFWQEFGETPQRLTARQEAVTQI